MAIAKILSMFMLLTVAVLGDEVNPVDAWTVFNSRITCGTSCTYDFFVRKVSSGQVFRCYVESPGRLDPILEETCHEEPSRTITLSWTPDGLVFCITDILASRIAFYAYDNWEIYNGSIASKTEWAWQKDAVLTALWPNDIVT
ncbi:hypothetical protein K449DRAFT_401784 [Hypoxylon sp. EC38]|nr:hypothetical protein K449DRAFT_401784 [Hypoxylon sp. EC38]